MLLTGPTAAEVAELLEEAGTPARLLDEREQADALPILQSARRARAPRRARRLDRRGQRRSGCSPARSGNGSVLAEVFAVDPGEPALIETSEGIWEAGRVVLCAGAGIATLAPELGIPIGICCHARATFRCVTPSMPGSPALQEQSGAYGETVYAAAFPRRASLRGGTRRRRGRGAARRPGGASGRADNRLRARGAPRPRSGAGRGQAVRPNRAARQPRPLRGVEKRLRARARRRQPLQVRALARPHARRGRLRGSAEPEGLVPAR